LLGRRSRLDFYNEREAVVVETEVRKDGMDGRGRNRYRKSWILKNVMFTLATESPSPAPTQSGAVAKGSDMAVRVTLGGHGQGSWGSG
jgi:hypothetical protein